MYIFTKKSLFENNARIADNAMLFEMSDIESQDIDWPDDFIITELIMKALYLSK
jgi:CMP-N-acetylneuraminic acid synthetase